jgi:hypothetical protein
MSAVNVEKVISRLLSEEELRIRFVLDPFDTLADLHERGLALSPHEIDVFVQSDAQIWFWEERRVGSRSH